jgi:mRNA interferase MazF
MWAVLDPVKGHEQAGRRPVLVLSEEEFSLSSGLAIICPITSKARGIPSEVILTHTKTVGVALPVQIRSIDISARKFVYIEKAPITVVNEAAQKAGVFIGLGT